MTEKTNGSVLVVGGGITGMQAALDLAESGYYVHLIEKSPEGEQYFREHDNFHQMRKCLLRR